MSKIMFAVLLAASSIFSGCNNRTPETGNATPQTANKTEEPANKAESTGPRSATVDPTNVTISLSGLMVYHQETSRPGYEVGIVPADIHGHNFEFKVDGEPKSLPGKSWTFEITNWSPPPSLEPPVAVGHSGRRPDVQAGRGDFDWIIDLDGPEFHSGLTMTEGVLGVSTPIIHLPNFSLYTKYKSIDLVRCQGGGGCKDSPGGTGTGPRADFGFLPETIAMDFVLQPSQTLVLKDETGASIELVKYPSPGQHMVKISNVRFPPQEKSDFSLYYSLLFKGVPPNQRYDFDGRRIPPHSPSPDSPPRYVAYNPHPGLSLRTCCQMECTSVRLVNRGTPLK